MTYARNTTVSAMRTRNQIEETLERYGADGFAYATQGNLATVIFAMENRRIRFVLELPDPEEFRYTNHSPPRERSDRAQREAYDQACRQRWRALLLVIKAKLEAVTAGISTIETEFLANIVLPDNATAGEWMLPQIDRAYRTGEMPPLLPAAGSDPDPPVPFRYRQPERVRRSWNRRSTVAQWHRRAGCRPWAGWAWHRRPSAEGDLMPEQQRPIVTELALADALDRLVNLIEELRVDADLRVEITTDETDLVKLSFSGTPDVGFAMRREVRDIPGAVVRRVWNEGLRDYEIV